MDCNWSQPVERPRYLYRVITPFTNTKWDPKIGFTAADRKPIYHRPEMYQFLESIDSHRSGRRIASPYISCFADRDEAESWTLGAGQIYGDEFCYMVWFDTRQEKLRYGTMWRVEDIQKKTAHLAKYNDEGLKPLCPCPVNSEWLILGSIPYEAMVGCTLVSGILAARARSMPPSQQPQVPMSDPKIRHLLATGIGGLPDILIPPFTYKEEEDQFLYQMLRRGALASRSSSAHHDGSQLHQAETGHTHISNHPTPANTLQEHHNPEYPTMEIRSILRFLRMNPPIGIALLLDLVWVDLELGRRAITTLRGFNSLLGNHRIVDIVQLPPDLGNRAFMNLMRSFPIQGNNLLIVLIMRDPALGHRVTTYLQQKYPAWRNHLLMRLQQVNLRQGNRTLIHPHRVDPNLRSWFPTDFHQLDPALYDGISSNVTREHRTRNSPQMKNRGQEHHQLGDISLGNPPPAATVQKWPSRKDYMLNNPVQNPHNPETPISGNCEKNSAVSQTPVPQAPSGIKLADLAMKALLALEENH